MLDLFGDGTLTSDGQSVSLWSGDGQASAISRLLDRILAIVVNGSGAANALTCPAHSAGCCSSPGPATTG